jgi:ribosome-associated translation inhibitor RaiA
MILDIDLKADRVMLDKSTRRYAQKVIGTLDKYLPKSARQTARAAVLLTRIDQPHGNKYEALVTIHLPGRSITAKDTTLNVLAALDIVRAKLIAELTSM